MTEPFNKEVDKILERYGLEVPAWAMLASDLADLFDQLQAGIQDLAKTNYELGCKIEDDYKPYIKRLQAENEQLKTELAELKPQALLLRQFLNNAHADIEQLAVENKRLQVELEKNKTYEKQ